MDGKKIQGITQGQYYLRKTGPESAPIQTATEWAPVIRRCAMHERASILAALDVALLGTNRIQTLAPDALKRWHDAAHAAFMKDVAERKAGEQLAQSHWQLSYSIERSDEQHLAPQTLPNALREINSEVRDLVKTGWSMFYIFNVPEIRPSWRTDEASGFGERDFLECALLKDTRDRETPPSPDMWRVSPDGKAILIRDYSEDGLDWNRSLGWKSGTWFSPNLLVRAVAGFVRHARGMAERFDSPTTVTFRVEWHGLNGRIIRDPFAVWRSNWTAPDDHRVAIGSWPLTRLTAAWPEIVAELVSPVMRLFTTEFVLSADWVRGQAPKWLRE